MDPLAAASFVLGITHIIPLIISLVATSGFQYRTRRFGLIWGAFLFLSSIVDTDSLQRAHLNINLWTDAEILTWKESHLAACNAVAVAVRNL